jgi:alkylation response protein AidB-like acyl-CoA dehydrogenase
VDFSFSMTENEFRQDVRGWLEGNLPEKTFRSGDTAEGFAEHLDWEKTLFRDAWAVVSWPKEFGGRGASLIQWLLFEEEYYAAGAPSRVTQNGIFLLAPTLFEHGTREQQERILPPMAAGEYVWCQGWSEPNAGSDLASLKSTGTKVEGGWLLNGQKTWCTRGAFCDGMFGLFRTDPEEKRHRGLTYFMVDLQSPGVTVRPVQRLDGDEGFAEVFLEDVFVPDSEVIGEVNRGWYVAMSTASSERGLTLRSPGRFLASARDLVALFQAKGDVNDTLIRDRVIKCWSKAEAYRLYTFQAAARIQKGEKLGAESSMNKIYWSEMDLEIHETAIEILGTSAEQEGMLHQGRDWMKGYQFALAGPIYAGTNEIQRNVIAEHVLGLPRG